MTNEKWFTTWKYEADTKLQRVKLLHGFAAACLCGVFMIYSQHFTERGCEIATKFLALTHILMCYALYGFLYLKACVTQCVGPPHWSLKLVKLFMVCFPILIVIVGFIDKGKLIPSGDPGEYDCILDAPWFIFVLFLVGDIAFSILQLYTFVRPILALQDNSLRKKVLIDNLLATLASVISTITQVIVVMCIPVLDNPNSIRMTYVGSVLSSCVNTCSLIFLTRKGFKNEDNSFPKPTSGSKPPQVVHNKIHSGSRGGP